MGRDLIDNWNEVVAPEDEVYFLGDFSLSFKFVTQVMPLLKGKIHLVAGNHDLCHSSNTGSGAYLQRYKEAGFYDICERTTLEIAGQSVLCCHLPYFAADDPDERYPDYKPDDDGRWLLHGHVHRRWKTKERQINVGVDVWDYYPVSINEIEKLIAG
jgi:calcineurin-like phosphoesterase family protein